MEIYICTLCGYVYNQKDGDESNDISPNTPWEALPNDWECPICGASKEDFEKE